MSNEYLWDGRGTPGPDDRDVAQLEQMLAPLRRALPPLPVLVDRAYATAPYTGIRFQAPMLAAAASIALMVGAVWHASRTMPSWEVVRIAGAPQVGSTLLEDTGRIAAGQTLATDHRSRARMDVAGIGQVTVDTESRVRLVETRPGRHRLALERGKLHAFITAPPRQFVVDTPSSTATDLGCIYTLEVDDGGTGMLSVASGWVAFELNGRESFVPAGASARTNPDTGPGTPRYDDAADQFRRALDRFDTERDPARRSEALAFVLQHARGRDAMTLWHLLARAHAAERPAVIDALDRRVSLPDGVSRDRILRLDRAALDAWWDALGLDDATWWRQWKLRN